MSSVQTISALATFGDVVPEGYDYYKKVITPGDDLILPNAYLKWYDLYPKDTPITAEQSAETRAFIAAEAEAGRLVLNGDLGFVILHRAGTVLLLLFNVWRNTNEIWEAVYVQEAETNGTYQPITFETSPKATYCVWELGAVWHERNAWVRFLSSKRDDTSKLAYIKDRFVGSV